MSVPILVFIEMNKNKKPGSNPDHSGGDRDHHKTGTGFIPGTRVWLDRPNREADPRPFKTDIDSDKKKK
jgi:hypothetical protein